MRIVGSQNADFVRAIALRVTESVLQAQSLGVNALFAHNDEMALGAIQAVAAAGLRPGADVTVVSIDGERLALEAILRGELGASVESNPRFGPLAFDALSRFHAGKPVPPRIILEDRLFEATNARSFLAEAY